MSIGGWIWGAVCTVVGGTAAVFAAPVVMPMIGAAGLLGAAGTGTAIASLSGAALTSASCAFVTGTIAGSTAVIGAAGAVAGAAAGAGIGGSSRKRTAKN